MVAAEVHEISAAFLDLGTLVARQADDVHRATTLADEASAEASAECERVSPAAHRRERDASEALELQ